MTNQGTGFLADRSKVCPRRWLGRKRSRSECLSLCTTSGLGSRMDAGDRHSIWRRSADRMPVPLSTPRCFKLWTGADQGTDTPSVVSVSVPTSKGACPQVRGVSDGRIRGQAFYLTDPISVPAVALVPNEAELKVCPFVRLFLLVILIDRCSSNRELHAREGGD